MILMIYYVFGHIEQHLRPSKPDLKYHTCVQYLFFGWPVETDEKYVCWKAANSFVGCHHYVHIHTYLSAMGITFFWLDFIYTRILCDTFSDRFTAIRQSFENLSFLFIDSWKKDYSHWCA